jgi:hypothetical protein
MGAPVYGLVKNKEINAVWLERKYSRAKGHI